MKSVLLEEIMNDAYTLMEHTQGGKLLEPGLQVFEFHFNTKLAHCLTGWLNLLQSKPEALVHYQEWRALASEFVAHLPTTEKANARRGRNQDPFQASRKVFTAPDIRSHRNLYDLTNAMVICAQKAGGTRTNNSGLFRDHLNLVELSAEMGWISPDLVEKMTLRCLGKTQTNKEVNELFAVTLRADRIASQGVKPEFQLLKRQEGEKYGLLRLGGHANSFCRFPVALVDRPSEHWIVLVEPIKSEATSLTNMAEKAMRAMETLGKNLRHPAQRTRFFEVYEADFKKGVVDEIQMGKNESAHWKRVSDPYVITRVIKGAQAAVATAEETCPVPKKQITLSETLRKLEGKHGLNTVSYLPGEKRVQPIIAGISSPQSRTL